MFREVIKTARGKWAVALIIIAAINIINSICESEFSFGTLLVSAILSGIAAALISSISKPEPKVNTVIVENDDEKVQKETPIVNLKVSLTSTSYEVDVMLDEREEVTRLALDGLKGKSGGYVNYSYYKLIGTNPQTNRKNTRYYNATNEKDLVSKAKVSGLVEPFEISITPHPKDTERENYFKTELVSYGIIPPADAMVDDLRDILNRVRYSDIVVSETKSADGKMIQKVKAMPSPNEELASFAHDIGLMFSLYVSDDNLFNSLIYSLNPTEKAAFWAYCILCLNDNTVIGDMRKSDYYQDICDFAEKATRDASLLKSIVARDANDFKNPNKGTIAYKAVVDYFDLR